MSPLHIEALVQRALVAEAENALLQAENTILREKAGERGKRQIDRDIGKAVKRWRYRQKQKARRRDA